MLFRSLDAVRVILDAAPSHLNPHGTLVVEIGDGKDAVEATFPKLPFVWLHTRSSDDSVFLLKREDLKPA